ncbi:hypothetical protein GE061_010155 [Apolygus lucorum]|uniref:RanBP-type and C3HC4-type zinc finger-containing protein 1 n=1 Tax=Apolygus lucorum TaxID=248454 RepID=A0A8S9Y2J0_APOLU|nr:hypothetical protein GE061_010155 [Apolygus lucorum]
MSPNLKTRSVSRNEEISVKDTQTSDIAYKPCLSNDQEEDRKKLREMLKEMKHSLPKRSKDGKATQISNNADDSQKVAEAPRTDDQVRKEIRSPKLGAIRKVIAEKTPKPIENNYKHGPSNQAEAYLVESETVVEEIKIRKPTEKVSSSAQTSSMVRQINPHDKPPSGKEVIVPITVEEYQIKDGVLYTSVTKKAKRIGSGTFQLMRPRDFANIEAIKTKSSSAPLYANMSSESEQTPSQGGSSKVEEVEQLSLQLTEPQGLAHFRAGLTNTNDTNNMNTIAVNRLLRRLESAIANGQHELAAALAKELAQLKVNCVVTRQKPETPTSQIQVDMYVEDKEIHQGPFPLQLKLSTTVEQLKLKVEREYEIPCGVQRWIIGKALANDDKATLESLGVTHSGSALYLYLVVPEDPALTNLLPPQKELGSLLKEDSSNDLEGTPLRTEIITIKEVFTPPVGSNELTKKEVDKPVIVDKKDCGWRCGRCTLVNLSSSPGCAACGSERQNEQETAVQTPKDQKPQVMPANNEKKVEEKSAKVLEEEKKLDYQKLVDLEKSDLIICTETFECPICIVEYQPYEGVVLRECLHVFCRACLANTVEYSDEAEVKCPFRNDKYTCDSTLLEREIKSLVTPVVYEQHLAKSIALAETKIGNAFHCKTPDCKGWCIFEDNVNSFRCPVCSHTNCLTCQAVHEGVDCKQFQEQFNKDSELNVEAKRTKEMLQEMVDRGEAMNCPTCQVVLMKKWGCDWLRCSMCKTEICWITRGPRWGPNGKGDTSGGCQCGVNGIKCHPSALIVIKIT